MNRSGGGGWEGPFWASTCFTDSQRKPDALLMAMTPWLGSFASRKRAPRGEKRVLVEKSFRGMIFECSIDLLTQRERERIAVEWGKSYNSEIRDTTECCCSMSYGESLADFWHTLSWWLWLIDVSPREVPFSEKVRELRRKRVRGSKSQA